MRTVGGLLASMIERENLVRAAWRASAGRQDQPAVRRFFNRFDEELAGIAEELRVGQPRCGDCREFTIHDPKERRITAPIFRERVLHHAVMAVCEPVLERRLTHHTYACRRGKGTVAAVRSAMGFARQSGWFLKCDVQKYFESIPRETLVGRLHRVFREPVVCRILEVLIHSYEPGRARGLPIGSLISQHLANFYLATLDTLVLQELRPCGYVRYMDDFVLWAADGSSLLEARERLRSFAESDLGLNLKPNAFINRCRHGMDFLGFRIFPNRLALSRRSRARFQRKLAVLEGAWRHGELSERDYQDRATALAAFTQLADCLEWRRRAISEAEDAPWTLTASCGGEAGTTTAGGAGRPTGTRTNRRTGTTTSASVPS